MSTIKDFFNGDIRPYEMLTCTREMLVTNMKLEHCLDKADELIPKENNKHFSDMIRDEVSDLQNYSAEQAFELGFSLGVRLTAECYAKT